MIIIIIIIKVVLLHALMKLGALLPLNVLEAQLWPLAIEMAEDKVPNLRIEVAKALEALGPILTSSLVHEKLLPKLQELAGDEDIDVKWAADEAIKTLDLKHDIR